MAITTTVAAQQNARHPYADPTGRAWDLDQSFLDFHASGWAWDRQPYDAAAGPVLHSAAEPDRHELLLALVVCAGLWQVPLSAPQDLAHWMDPLDETFRICAGPAVRA